MIKQRKIYNAYELNLLNAKLRAIRERYITEFVERYDIDDFATGKAQDQMNLMNDLLEQEILNGIALAQVGGLSLSSAYSHIADALNTQYILLSYDKAFKRDK